MANDSTPRTYKENFTFHDSTLVYDIQLRSPKPWWLLLLLLVPLLLLVRCSREIVVHTIDEQRASVPAAAVRLDYTEHQVFKEGRFLFRGPHSLEQTTDSVGCSSPMVLEGSVYSLLFHRLETAHLEGRKGSRRGERDFVWQKLFSRSDTVDLVLSGSREVIVKDIYTKEPIEGADVRMKLSESPDSLRVLSGRDGSVPFVTQAETGSIEGLVSRKEGYHPTVEKDIPYGSPDDSVHVVYMYPVGSADLRIVNKRTGEPLAGADVEVVLSDSPDPVKATTGPDGRVPLTFKDRDGKVVSVKARKDGFTPAEQKDIPYSEIRDKGRDIPLAPYEDLVLEVRDSVTKEPISGATVVMDLSDSGLVTATSTTSGEVRLRTSDPDGRIVTATASRRGYSKKTENNIPYKVIKREGHVIYLDPIKRCSDAEAFNGKSNNRGNHSVESYDLGKPGSFVFKFYTDTACDVIRVYDLTKAEYAAGKRTPLLFEYGARGETTRTTDYSYPAFHRTLTSKKGEITVTVDNGTHWGYVVTCPK